MILGAHAPPRADQKAVDAASRRVLQAARRRFYGQLIGDTLNLRIVGYNTGVSNRMSPHFRLRQNWLATALGIAALAGLYAAQPAQLPAFPLSGGSLLDHYRDRRLRDLLEQPRTAGQRLLSGDRLGLPLCRAVRSDLHFRLSGDVCLSRRGRKPGLAREDRCPMVCESLIPGGIFFLRRKVNVNSALLFYSGLMGAGDGGDILFPRVPRLLSWRDRVYRLSRGLGLAISCTAYLGALCCC